MRFAIVGDVHGHFDKLAELLNEVNRQIGPLSVVFSVGDVKPNRSEKDSIEVHEPTRYRSVGTFPDLLSKRFSLPAEFWFIGGNHDPWRALDDHGPGEWAPGIHFLGRAGVRNVHGLRVAFLSGVYSPQLSPTRGQRDGAKERTYFKDSEVHDVIALSGHWPVDLLLTHDWPAGMTFEKDGKQVGQPILRELAEGIRPKVYAVGHMHAPHRDRIGETEVICLDKVGSGIKAVTVLEYDHETGAIQEIDASCVELPASSVGLGRQ